VNAYGMLEESNVISPGLALREMRWRAGAKPLTAEKIVAALKDELDHAGPAMFQSHVSELAGELASRLCERTGGRLSRVFFCSSGSESIEAAIKFVRAYTGRSGLLYAQGAFYGLTCGTLP
jgi:ornithine--oxo-acid transaminase